MQDLVDTLSGLLKAKGMKLACAESCTGGLLSATITNKSGASDIFERGFITYSNESKVEMLGVSEEIIKQHGAVSAETASSMAKGALKNSQAQLSVSITGIAGPDGGSTQKPVGLVYFGYALKDGSSGSLEGHFEGKREEIQARAVIEALKHLISILQESA